MKALHAICHQLQISPASTSSTSCTVESYVNVLAETKRAKERVLDLKAALCSSGTKVVSSSMAAKIAENGLSIHHLKLAYQRKGRSGIVNLLSVKFNGRPLVTSRKAILDAVGSFLENSAQPTSQ